MRNKKEEPEQVEQLSAVQQQGGCCSHGAADVDRKRDGTGDDHKPDQGDHDPALEQMKAAEHRSALLSLVIGPFRGVFQASSL